MVAGVLVESDGTPLPRRDCIAAIQRFAKPEPIGGASVYRAIMPEWLAWLDAPDLATQKAPCEQMQARVFEDPSYAPLGMYVQPTVFHNYLRDIRDGWPQFYGVKKNA